MKESIIGSLYCPQCRKKLECEKTKIECGEIKEGALTCNRCFKKYPIRNYIPRFVEADNYASSFGLEWNKHARTQIDKFNGTNISRSRFYRETNWNPKDLKNQKILEAGCGAGRFTQIALETGAEVYSFDLSNSVDACLSNNGLTENLHIFQASIYELPFQKEYFDKIFCFGVLQHTPDVRKAFLSLVPYLKEGGEIVVDVYKLNRRDLGTYVHPKHYLRLLTKRIDDEKLYRIVCRIVPILLHVSIGLRKIPIFGRYLSFLIPVANYKGRLPIKDEDLLDWAILDTFDWLSPAYDNPQTVTTVTNWFIEAGLTNIQVTSRGLIIGRGTRAYVGRTNSHGDKKMRIFMVCNVLLSEKDNSTIHIIELLKNLAKRNDVICFAPKPKNVKYKFQEIAYTPILNKPIFLSISYQWALFFNLFYYCCKARPDALYARLDMFTFSPLIISKLFRIPYFVEINGVMLEEMKLSNSFKLNVCIAKISEKLNYKRAKRIIAVTQAIKKAIKKKYDIPDEKVVVIENGANTDLFKPMNPQKTMKELNLNENCNYVCFSGSFARWHGLEDLVKSAPLVLKEVENTKFILVGDGLMKKKIVQMVNDLNLTDSFIFINRVPYEEVAKYVNIFDVCVILKKRDIPGCPLKLYEYMACGKPVIATNTEDFRVLEEYNAGILVDPEKTEEVADAITTLLKNKDLREEMGKNGRKYATENRSWEAVAREVEKVMKDAVK